MQGDASRCVAQGLGLKSATVGRQAEFSVDCSRAGQDLLWVSVVTPRGPSDEVYVKHQGNGFYNVNYLIKVALRPPIRPSLLLLSSHGRGL